MCQECYRALAGRSHTLAEQVVSIGGENHDLKQELARLRTEPEKAIHTLLEEVRLAQEGMEEAHRQVAEARTALEQLNALEEQLASVTHERDEAWARIDLLVGRSA